MDDAPAATMRSARTLIERCLRYSADRQRLEAVLEGIQRDESAARRELAALIGEAGPASPRQWNDSSCHPMVRDDPTPISSESWPDQGEDRLAIRLLGRFTIVAKGREVVGPGADRAISVLRYLASQPSVGTHKEQLAARFWPGSDGRIARRNLHQAIYTIRRLLGRVGAQAELTFDNDHYRLGQEPPWRDVDELTRWADVARDAERLGDGQGAIDALRRVDLLYAGPFLADYPYDDWAVGPREHFRLLHRQAGLSLLSRYSTNDDHCSSIQLATRLLGLDPCDESACRHLMVAHCALGEANLAHMAFGRLTHQLRDRLEAKPSEQTVRLSRSLIGKPVEY